MAKIIQPPTRGSIGNVTHSANRSGQILRQRSIPTQPNTAAQSAQKARIASLSAAWRGLTSTQIAAWNAFANSFTTSNSLGVSGHMTGHQAYVKVNSVNMLNGDAVVAVPPALPSFIGVTVTAVTSTAGTPTVALAGTTPGGTTKYMVYCTPPKSAGVSFVNDFRWLQTSTTFTSGSLSILTAFEAKFGAPVAGKKMFVKVVQSQAGMQDNGTVFICVVGA